MPRFTTRLDPGPRAHQEVTTTASRRAQPRAWMRAVRWLVGAGLHPRVNATTLRVAADLARRMDYTEGTVLYDMTGTARRLDASVPTVKRHVAILRELGTLVWIEHGSRKNLHLPGRKYTATATVYGATIPPGYDNAMGHRIDGCGYEARIIGVTGDGRRRAVTTAWETSATRPREGREPPSPGRCPTVEKVRRSGGLKDTPRKRVARPRTTAPNTTSSHRRRHRGRGTGRPAHRVARGIAIARQVRPLVCWTQTECLRRLAFALRPLIDAGLDAPTIAAELHSWHLDWRPARPAAYLTAELRRRAARDTAVLPGTPTEPTPAFRAALTREDDSPVLADIAAADGAAAGGDPLAGLAREEIVSLRAAALNEPALVRSAIENLGMRHARRLYTSWLVYQSLVRAYRVSDRTVIGV